MTFHHTHLFQNKKAVNHDLADKDNKVRKQARYGSFHLGCHGKKFRSRKTIRPDWKYHSHPGNVYLLVRHRPCIAKVQNSYGLVQNVQAGKAGTNVTPRPQFCTMQWRAGSVCTLYKGCSDWKNQYFGETLEKYPSIITFHSFQPLC